MQETNPTISEIENLDQPGGARRVLLTTLGLLVAFVLGLGAGYMVWARPLEARVAAAEQQVAEAAQKAAAAAQDQQAQQQQGAAPQGAEQQGAAQQEVKRYPVPLDDDPIFGIETAEITIIEFSDYECPFCRSWHQEVWPQIQEKYGDQVRLVYRDFPLYSIHPNAGPAAEAANCAGEQDQYWPFNEKLFNEDNPLGRETYESYAADLKLDLDSFKKCLDEKRYTKEVDGDYNYASELGVRSTPTFFVNGLAIVGAQPFDVFERIIDMELAGEIP